MIAAGNFADNQTKLFTLDGQEYIRTAAWQEAIGFVFFNTLQSSSSLDYWQQYCYVAF